MILLAHRGYWKKKPEQNKLKAFTKSYELGFGFETDLREKNKKIIISHDIPSGAVPSLNEILKNYPKKNPVWLALNIKSDGLADLVERQMRKSKIKNYFVFDMSVPETIKYSKTKIPFFTRVSDYEKDPVLLEKATGVWLDAFDSEWFNEQTIRRYLEASKYVCLVSSELHKRDYQSLWKNLKNWNLHKHPKMMLCTDFPIEAQDYFL